MSLKTDYKNDILDLDQNTQRKYSVITNSDGTISLQDATVYAQNGDEFGAGDINATNEAVNNVVTEVIGKLGDQVTLTLSGTTLTITRKATS